MSKQKNTPGPWHWVGTNARPLAKAYLQNADYQQVVVILDGNGPSEDDARLIAAAPELLEACKMLLKCGDYAMNRGDGLPVPSYELRAVITEAGLAIAKAEGK